MEYTDDVSTASDKAENEFDVWCNKHAITSSSIKTEENKLRPDRLAFIDSTNMFGFSFINPHDGFGSSLTGMSRWIYNEILGTIVAWLFAIFWGMKTASDIH